MDSERKRGLLYFVVGSALALIIWGVQLIGVVVNILLGGTVLAIAFGLVVYAFWIWERLSTWHVLLRIGTITIAAVIYFLFVGKQMIAEWHKEHPLVAVKSPEPAPQVSPVPTQEKPKRREKPEPTPVVTQQQSGKNNAQTGPIAIAPNGIANAAPNSGNQTVNNNFAPPPRTLPPDARAECIALLSGTRAKVSVNSLAGDSEGFNYAKEWYDLFHESGWEMADDQVRTLLVVGQPPVGVEVRFRGERPTISNQPVSIPQFLVPLQNCFVKLKVHCVGNPFPDMPENSIFFVIGSH